MNPVRFLCTAFSLLTQYLRWCSVISEITQACCLSVPPAQSRLLPMASSPTRPSATETVSTGSWTSSPACCPLPRRSAAAWTNCPCSAWAWDTWRSRASLTVRPLAGCSLCPGGDPGLARLRRSLPGHRLNRCVCLTSESMNNDLLLVSEFQNQALAVLVFLKVREGPAVKHSALTRLGGSSLSSLPEPQTGRSGDWNQTRVNRHAFN